ncbi:hypothetical protein HKD37_17G048565 [Glycine soja]
MNREVSGDWETRYSVVFRIGSFVKYVYQPGPLGPSSRFLQKAVASGGSNLARLGELGGKLLPYFAINRGRSEEEKDAPVPIPTNEVSLVGQALHTFLAWPTHLVKSLSHQVAVSLPKPPPKPDPEVDDPLYLMTLTIPELFLRPYQVRWDATVFGVVNPDFPLYIKHKHLSEIAHSGQCLSILSIQRFGQSQFESESYIKSWMQSSQCYVYLGAYLNGPDNYLKGIINSAIKGLDDAPQPKSKAPASVATYPSAGGRRETRGMRVPRKEYARSRHQRLFEENVGKTGKDAIYELLTPRLRFSSRKQFFQANSKEREVPKGAGILFFFIFSPIYSKIGEMLAAQLAQASSARPGEQGCFLQKQPPSGGIFWRAQMGLVAICTPIFTKMTKLGLCLSSGPPPLDDKRVRITVRMTKLSLCLSSGPPPLDDKRVRITVRMTKLGLCLSSGPPPLDDKRVRITVRYLRVSWVQNDQTWSLLAIGHHCVCLAKGMTKLGLCLSSGPPPLDDKRVRITVRMTKLGLCLSSGPPPLDDKRVRITVRMTKLGLCLSSGPPPLDDKRVRITVRMTKLGLCLSSGPPPLDDKRVRITVRYLRVSWVQNDQTWSLLSPTVATYPSAGGRRETRGMRVPRKEYARSRHQRLFEENVGKTGKDAIYELLTPRLRFSSRKQFFQANSKEREVPKGAGILFFFIFSPIYSKIGEMLAAQLAQASSARPGEQGCFLQKQPPSGGIFWRAQMGLVAICTPIFTKFTPPAIFWPMATPPSSPPPHRSSPPPPTKAASRLPSTLKRTRKSHTTKIIAGADRSVVHVDPSIGKADGPHKKKLRTYLGIVAPDKVNVMNENWKQATTAQKDLIWKDIQTVGERWRQFKSDLTLKWVLVADKDNLDDTVCEKYGISKEKWAQFCQCRRDPSWEDVRKKSQAIQKQNTAPHVLARGGYEYLERKLLAEKIEKKLEEVAESESTEAVIDPPSPIRWHVKWNMARTKKTGHMTSEAAKEIAKKIDVLTTAIGRPEHPGRVCAAGANVTIKQYFGSAPRISHTSSSMAPEELEDQLKESNIEKSQFQSEMQSYGLALPLEPEVGPSAARVSTKESYVDPSGNDPDMGDSDKCGLYIEQNPPHLVALGRVYEGSTTIHNIPLLHDQVKVGVEEVKHADAPVPVPTNEALNTYLAWPTHLVKHLLEQGVVGPAKLADRPDHEVDDPLYLMTLTIPQLFLKPFQVMWDATVFRVFNEDFPLYIKHEDLSEIAHGGQCLNISVIQLWILHLTETSIRAGNSDVYGFLEPQSIQRSRQSQFESESYMKN